MERYRVIERIGAGSHGEVFLVEEREGAPLPPLQDEKREGRSGEARVDPSGRREESGYRCAASGVPGDGEIGGTGRQQGDARSALVPAQDKTAGGAESNGSTDGLQQAQGCGGRGRAGEKGGGVVAGESGGEEPEPVQRRRSWVMKVIPLPDTREERAKCLKEAATMLKLRHPCVVSCKESFIDPDQGVFCIAMEKCSGGELRQLINRQSETGQLFEEGQVVDWLVQLLLALEYLNHKKVLHRDLKSENIFLRNPKDFPHGNFATIQLGDFGISRVLKHRDEVAESFVGTPLYMSPELIRNEPYNHKSDVWALGCILYEMMCLRKPFEAFTVPDLMHLVLNTECDSPPALYSQDLCLILGKMLLKNAEERPDAATLLASPLLRDRAGHFLASCRDFAEEAHAASANLQSPTFKRRCHIFKAVLQQATRLGLKLPDAPGTDTVLVAAPGMAKSASEQGPARGMERRRDTPHRAEPPKTKKTQGGRRVSMLRVENSDTTGSLGSLPARTSQLGPRELSAGDIPALPKDRKGSGSFDAQDWESVDARLEGFAPSPAQLNGVGNQGGAHTNLVPQAPQGLPSGSEAVARIRRYSSGGGELLQASQDKAWTQASRDPPEFQQRRSSSGALPQTLRVEVRSEEDEYGDGYMENGPSHVGLPSPAWAYQEEFLRDSHLPGHLDVPMITQDNSRVHMMALADADRLAWLTSAEVASMSMDERFEAPRSFSEEQGYTNRVFPRPPMGLKLDRPKSPLQLRRETNNLWRGDSAVTRDMRGQLGSPRDAVVEARMNSEPLRRLESGELVTLFQQEQPGALLAAEGYDGVAASPAPAGGKKYLILRLVQPLQRGNSARPRMAEAMAAEASRLARGNSLSAEVQAAEEMHGINGGLLHDDAAGDWLVEVLSPAEASQAQALGTASMAYLNDVAVPDRHGHSARFNRLQSVLEDASGDNPSSSHWQDGPIGSRVTERQSLLEGQPHLRDGIGGLPPRPRPLHRGHSIAGPQILEAAGAFRSPMPGSQKQLSPLGKEDRLLRGSSTGAAFAASALSSPGLTGVPEDAGFQGNAPTKESLYRGMSIGCAPHMPASSYSTPGGHLPHEPSPGGHSVLHQRGVLHRGLSIGVASQQPARCLSGQSPLPLSEHQGFARGQLHVPQPGPLYRGLSTGAALQAQLYADQRRRSRVSFEERSAGPHSQRALLRRGGSLLPPASALSSPGLRGQAEPSPGSQSRSQGTEGHSRRSWTGRRLPFTAYPSPGVHARSELSPVGQEQQSRFEPKKEKLLRGLSIANPLPRTYSGGSSSGDNMRNPRSPGGLRLFVQSERLHRGHSPIVELQRGASAGGVPAFGLSPSMGEPGRRSSFSQQGRRRRSFTKPTSQRTPGLPPRSNVLARHQSMSTDPKNTARKAAAQRTSLDEAGMTRNSNGGSSMLQPLSRRFPEIEEVSQGVRPVLVSAASSFRGGPEQRERSAGDVLRLSPTEEEQSVEPKQGEADSAGVIGAGTATRSYRAALPSSEEARQMAVGKDNSTASTMERETLYRPRSLMVPKTKSLRQKMPRSKSLDTPAVIKPCSSDSKCLVGEAQPETKDKRGEMAAKASDESQLSKKQVNMKAKSVLNKVDSMERPRSADQRRHGRSLDTRAVTDRATGSLLQLRGRSKSLAKSTDKAAQNFDGQVPLRSRASSLKSDTSEPALRTAKPAGVSSKEDISVSRSRDPADAASNPAGLSSNEDINDSRSRAPAGWHLPGLCNSCSMQGATWSPAGSEVGGPTVQPGKKPLLSWGSLFAGFKVSLGSALWKTDVNENMSTGIDTAESPELTTTGTYGNIRLRSFDDLSPQLRRKMVRFHSAGDDDLPSNASVRAQDGGSLSRSTSANHAKSIPKVGKPGAQQASKDVSPDAASSAVGEAGAAAGHKDGGETEQSDSSWLREVITGMQKLPKTDNDEPPNRQPANLDNATPSLVETSEAHDALYTEDSCRRRADAAASFRKYGRLGRPKALEVEDVSSVGTGPETPSSIEAEVVSPRMGRILKKAPLSTVFGPSQRKNPQRSVRRRASGSDI